MKKVITYGTFDLLHYGHVNFLRNAKLYGEYLIVGLSSDEFNFNSKGKRSYFTYEQRKLTLEALRYVDKIIPELTWEQKPSDILKHDIDVLIMGDDWAGKFDHLNRYCKVVYIPRTENISSSLIKRELHKINL